MAKKPPAKRLKKDARKVKRFRTWKAFSKRLQKGIDAAEYVKVQLAENNGEHLEKVEGIVLGQITDLVLMSDSWDFHYDGLVVFRKCDIDVVTCTDNERFMKKMLIKEGYYSHVKKRLKALRLDISSMTRLLMQLRDLKLPVIIECKYDNDDIFQIGSIEEVTDKKVRINHFNPQGVIGAKPVASKLKDITLIKIDSPYANTFYKYTSRIG